MLGLQQRTSIEILGASLAAHAFALALPLAMLQTYDRIIANQSYGTLYLLAGGVLFAIILEMALRFGRSVYFAHIGARIEAEATIGLVESALKADVSAVEKAGAARLTEVLRSVARLRDFWSGSAAASLYELPFIAIYIGLVAYIGGWLALIPASLAALALVFALGLARGIELESEKVRDQTHAVNRFVWCVFEGLAEVKSLAAEALVSRRYAELQSRLLAHSARLETRTGWVREIGTTLGQLATVLIVALGAGLVIDGSITTGGLAACTLLAGRSVGPLMAAFAFVGRYKEMESVRRDIDDIEGLPRAPLHVADRATMVVPERWEPLEISLPAVLPRPLALERGAIVRLRGNEPRHITRLMECIAGLSRLEGAAIKIGGESLGDIDGSSLNRAVSYVSGASCLLPGTILSNLTLFDGRLNAEARSLAEQLGLQRATMRLAHGLLSDVGPLSDEVLDTGVVQRVSLIRALLQRPSIVLLDHAASGLDLEGQKHLAEFLLETRNERILLMATNVPALAEICDRAEAVARREPVVG